MCLTFTIERLVYCIAEEEPNRAQIQQLYLRDKVLPGCICNVFMVRANNSIKVCLPY